MRRVVRAFASDAHIPVAGGVGGEVDDLLALAGAIREEGALVVWGRTVQSKVIVLGQVIQPDPNGLIDGDRWDFPVVHIGGRTNVAHEGAIQDRPGRPAQHVIGLEAIRTGRRGHGHRG